MAVEASTRRFTLEEISTCSRCERLSTCDLLDPTNESRVPRGWLMIEGCAYSFAWNGKSISPEALEALLKSPFKDSPICRLAMSGLPGVVSEKTIVSTPAAT